MQLRFERLARWQHRQIFRDVDSALAQLKQLDLLLLLSGTQDDADGGLLVGLLLMPGKPAQVELHLALVFRLESPELQLDCDEALKFPVIEQQVQIIPTSA